MMTESSDEMVQGMTECSCLREQQGLSSSAHSMLGPDSCESIHDPLSVLQTEKDVKRVLAILLDSSNPLRHIMHCAVMAY
ncbi:hypothetical protein E2C01_088871 [Portunus trituberculatus]|uniref:Uncharacterized protein n=1 Tax=Portunus trituberculatus TaxID=210409 RepID=A0A5B7J7B4_PORTR|nr:hypothetical protein [Portunus trituberculatus]